MNEKWLKYAPKLLFDRNEPFYPVRIGVTELKDGDPSPSFRRRFTFDSADIDYVLEYAIYWDYDIQHLYELEHVWVYINKDGTVGDAEASFHGRYLKSLLPDRSNLDGTQVRLYSQPGKHAFSPMPELFELVPGYRTCTDRDAGLDGLTIPEWFDKRPETNAETNARVRLYLYNRFRFVPDGIFEEYEYERPQELFVPWQTLFEEIPNRIEHELAKIQLFPSE